MARKSIESDEMLQEFCDWFLTRITERKRKGRAVKDVDLDCTSYWLEYPNRVEVDDDVIVNGRNWISISIRVGDYEYVSTKDDSPRKYKIASLLVAKLEELFKD